MFHALCKGLAATACIGGERSTEKVRGNGSEARNNPSKLDQRRGVVVFRKNLSGGSDRSEVGMVLMSDAVVTRHMNPTPDLLQTTW